jgi:ATP-binding cassette subfamily B protein
MLYSLRMRTFAQLQRLSLDFYDREMSGQIMTRMTSDVESLSLLLQQGLLTGAVSLLTCSGVLVVLLVLDWRLALAAFVVMPFVFAATILFQRAATRAYLEAREHLSAVNADLQESLAGMAVTQAYRQERVAHGRFARRSRSHSRSRFRSMQLQSQYFSTLQFLTAVAKAITLGAGAHLIATGNLTTGMLIAFLLYLDQFFSPMQQMSATFDQWIQARVAIRRIDELLRIRSSTPERHVPVDPGRLRGDVRFVGVRFAYSPTAPEALRGIDLHIGAGETVALVGTTGAGKSTFVKLAARFYDATGGQILVDGCPITDLDLTAYRRQLGYVPQEPFLFSGTVASTIAYGRPDATEAEIEVAARTVGVHPFITSLPLGYRTPVTDGGRSLSAGQRQLLCLARALLVDPAILILDEATSNLDPATEAQVQAAMAVVGEGRTTLLIAHRLSTARTADRIAVIEGGLVAEVGDHETLLAGDGRYAELWGSHVEARPMTVDALEVAP